MIGEALLKGVEAGERCVRRQFRYASCEACIGICPTQALSWKEGIPAVDSDRCVMCAACLFVCPTEAIEGAEPEPRFFRGHTLVAPFSIIAPTTEELLFWHVEHHIRAVAMDPLSDPQWMLAIARLNLRLRAYGQPEWTFSPPAQSEINDSRRALFHARREKTASARIQPGLRRWRRLWPLMSDFQLAIDTQKCTLCGACWRACAQKSLAFDEHELRIEDTQCTGCGACTAVCVYQALTLTSATSRSGSQRFTASESRCACCQKSFWSLNTNEKRCLFCQRHAHGMRK